MNPPSTEHPIDFLPPLDRCAHCRQRRCDHIEDKCPFEASSFELYEDPWTKGLHNVAAYLGVAYSFMGVHDEFIVDTETTDHVSPEHNKKSK